MRSKEWFSMKTYLSVGTDYLDKNKFQEIENSFGFKPNYGIWATKQHLDAMSYNPWVDYLLNKDNRTFFLKYGNFEDYRIPAVLFSLKPTANIFYIRSKDDLNHLSAFYPSKHASFFIDFEKLAQDFDGIYFNIKQLSSEISENMVLKETVLKPISVNTLLLFNIDCIDFYQKAAVVISPTIKSNYVFLNEGSYEVISSDEQLSITTDDGSNQSLNRKKDN